jgi:hypothetical protein
MKRSNILDVLQVMAALLITSGMVVYAAPVPRPITPVKASINTVVPTKPKVVTPVTAKIAPVVTPVPAVTAPAPTWQDNPNHCDQNNQYIAATAPFACIDKQVATSASNTAQAAPAAAVVGGCGDNQYAQYIYQHESGCNLNAVNSGGCRGIGQACPGSKLPCGADYACQNDFFTNYAISKYGSWAAAYSFWTSNHWW